MTTKPDVCGNEGPFRLLDGTILTCDRSPDDDYHTEGNGYHSALVLAGEEAGGTMLHRWQDAERLPTRWEPGQACACHYEDWAECPNRGPYEEAMQNE